SLLSRSGDRSHLPSVPTRRSSDLPKRLEAALEPATFELATDADFKENSFLVKGYVGPRGLNANGVKVYADPRVVSGTSWITGDQDRKSTRLNSSHVSISYAVFCLK